MPQSLRLDARIGHTPFIRRAVTLLEVLVVVAVIALLIAILTPAFNNAREQSRAVVCESNQRQCLLGVLNDSIETTRRQKLKTSFGWAIPSVRKNSMETRILLCPSDPSPRPIPAVSAQVFYLNRKRCRPDEPNPDPSPSCWPYDEGDPYCCQPTPVGMTAADGIFNHLTRTSTGWELDIQNSCDTSWLGIDRDPDDHDLLLKYSATFPASTARVSAEELDRCTSFDILDRRDHLVWKDAKSDSRPTNMPLLWMSYGVNATAGLTHPAAKTILLAEAAKFGLFPTRLHGSNPSGKWLFADNFQATRTKGTPLRYRHGAASPDPTLIGADFTGKDWQFGTMPDPLYQPRSTMNVGFLDGHVQRRSFHELSDPQQSCWTGSLSWDKLRYAD